MTITRMLLAQVQELLGRGMTPLNIARSMAMKVEEIEKMICTVQHS